MRARRAGALSVAVVIVAAAVSIVAGTAPAGNRDPISTLAAAPGPAAVTYGQSTALTASLENRQKSTFTDVRFILPLPAGASVAASTCASSVVEAGELRCYWGHQLRAGKTATVVVVLTTPASGPSPLSLAGIWTIKEGQQDSGAPDTFPTNNVPVSLLSSSDPGKVSGFATTSCANPSSTPTIATPIITPLNGPGGPLSTSVCAQNLPTTPVTGIVASIVERNGTSGEPGISQVSEVCLPPSGAACSSTPFRFTPRATFTFAIDNTSLQACPSAVTLTGGSGGTGCTLPKITKVFHTTPSGTWQQVPKCMGTSPADPCYTAISFNSAKKVTTVSVLSSENGSWRFG